MAAIALKLAENVEPEQSATGLRAIVRVQKRTRWAAHTWDREARSH